MYVCVCVCLSVCVCVCLCLCVCIHPHFILFIHSAVDGNIDCFHVLAIVNNVAANIELCLCLLEYGFWVFFPDMSQGKKLLGHMVVLLLVL